MENKKITYSIKSEGIWSEAEIKNHFFNYFTRSEEGDEALHKEGYFSLEEVIDYLEVFKERIVDDALEARDTKEHQAEAIEAIFKDTKEEFYRHEGDSRNE